MGMRRNLFTGELEEVTPEEVSEFNQRQRRRAAESVEHLAKKTRSMAWTRPRPSRAMKVLPSQAKEFTESSKKNGGGVVYDKEGVPHFETQGQMNKELVHRGMYDRDACYGQHAGFNV